MRKSNKLIPKPFLLINNITQETNQVIIRLEVINITPVVIAETIIITQIIESLFQCSLSVCEGTCAVTGPR